MAIDERIFDSAEASLEAKALVVFIRRLFANEMMVIQGSRTPDDAERIAAECAENIDKVFRGLRL